MSLRRYGLFGDAFTVILLLLSVFSLMGLSGVVVASGHHYLMFDESDIPMLQERIKREPYSTWWSNMMSSTSDNALAFVWLISPYRSKLLDSLADRVKASLLGFSWEPVGPRGKAYMEPTSHRLKVAAEAYNLLYCYKGLTDEDRRIIEDNLAFAAEDLYNNVLVTAGGQNPGNQRILGASALGIVALAIPHYRNPKYHTPHEWLTRALEALTERDNLSMFLPDGLHLEGYGYSVYQSLNLLPFLHHYYRATGRNLFGEPWIKNWLLWWAYQEMPDGLACNIGTTVMDYPMSFYWEILSNKALGQDAGFFRFIREYKSRGLQSHGLTIPPIHPHMLVDVFCYFDDSIEPSVAGYPPTRFFPASQQGVMKSGWDNDACGIWFGGKAQGLSPYQYNWFSHADAGGFVLNAYGELLAVDSGYDHWKSFEYNKPDYHNVITIDGVGPQRNTVGLLRNMVTTDFMDLAEVYLNYEQTDVLRRFLFPGKDYFVIVDHVKGGRQASYTWNLHTPVRSPGGEVSISRNEAIFKGYDYDNGNGGKVSLVAYFASPVALESGKSRWIPVFGDGSFTAQENLTIRATQAGKEVVFLTVLFPVRQRDAKPTFENISLEGATGVKVIRNDGSGVIDTIIAQEHNSNITFSDCMTDGNVIVLREDKDGLAFFALCEGTYINYKGRDVFRSQERVGVKILARPR